MKATVGCNYGLPMRWLSSKAYMFAVFLMLIASEFGSCDVSLAAVSNPALPVPADRSSYKATVKSASKTASGKHNAISPEVIDVGRPSGSVSVVDDTYIETSSRNSSTSAPSALAGMNSTVSLPKSKPITNVTLTANVSSESVNVRSQSRPRTKATEGYSRTRKLPEAIIIGVKKGGTRALLEFLKIHPDIRAPGPEIHFFDRYYDKGLDWYRSRMPPTLPGQLTVEKTPSYFVTRSAPLRVRRSMPADVRLVVVVRDPVTRALSDYTQALVKRPDLLPFERMAFSDPPPILQQHQQLPPPPFAADDASISSSTPLATTNSSTDFHESRVNTSWGAVRIGLYARHLERWLRWFPRNRFHFVNGERLIDDPAGEIGRLEDFLGVQRVVTADHFYFNATKGFPCLKKSEARAVPRCLGQAKGRAHPSVDPSAIERLRRFFRPHNRRFYAMTGIDFGWT